MTLPHLRMFFHILSLDRCPSSHPYAYYNGEYCCASDYEKINESQGAKCDGSKIQLDSLCCRNDEHKRCPFFWMYGSCSNAGPASIPEIKYGDDYIYDIYGMIL